jgi:hypothetical protein
MLVNAAVSQRRSKDGECQSAREIAEFFNGNGL